MQFLKPAYLLEQIVKQLATAWADSKSKNSPDLLLPSYSDEELKEPEAAQNEEQQIDLKTSVTEEHKRQHR